ncbi:MAG: type IV pilus assembly protein FimV [Pseudomonadota bacterium]
MAPFRKSLSALLVGLSLSPVAWSLGFGELRLQSELNQPLQAEIPILGVPAYASDAIRVRLGKREDFAALGYDYAPEIDDIRTEIQQRDNRLVLQLRSRSALREPLLNLVLVAEEGNTRYLRDYAILLDLPGSSPQRPQALTDTTPATATADPAVTTAPAAVAVAVQTPPVGAATMAATTATSPVIAATTDAASTSVQTVYGPTQPGENLSLIAHRLGKAAGVEWQAYGVALYQANPTAFLAGDPNRLKAAVPLQLPTAAEVARYRRSDWLALFARPANVASANAMKPAAEATTSAESAVTESSSHAALLQTLQQQNTELKSELAAAAARMQALEAQLAQLDSRYLALIQQAAPAQTETLPAASPQAAPTQTETVPTAAQHAAPAQPSVDTATTAIKPVTVEVRDQLTATEAVAAATVPASTAEPAAADETPGKASVWQLIMWPLAIVAALIAAGAVFWQWRERRNHNRALKPRVRTPHIPKEVLPAAEVDEPTTPQGDTGGADRRILRIKQVQSALETYLAYQRFDRAMELLEHEMHIAGDDLVLRRQLQRLQKDVRNAQTEWQETHKEQMSDLFDRATTTQVDKPVARDDGKQTSG